MKRLKCNVSKEELFEIEQKILKNNNLYKFRCEQYKKLTYQFWIYPFDFKKEHKEWFLIFIETDFYYFEHWLFDFIMIQGKLDKEEK